MKLLRPTIEQLLARAKAGLSIGVCEYTGFKGSTSACAIGHGPQAGIEISDDDLSWPGYARRVFGTDEMSSEEGHYMFDLNNGGNHLDAAERIRSVINGTWKEEENDE